MDEVNIHRIPDLGISTGSINLDMTNDFIESLFRFLLFMAVTGHSFWFASISAMVSLSCLDFFLYSVHCGSPSHLHAPESSSLLPCNSLFRILTMLIIYFMQMII